MKDGCNDATLSRRKVLQLAQALCLLAIQLLSS